MRKKIKLTATAFLLAAVCALGMANKGCTDKQTADVSLGFSIEANGIASGYDTVHALRLAGDVEPATALKLAREALDANSVSKEIVGGMLDLKALGADEQAKLADQLDVLIPRLNTLISDGTLHVHNGKVQVFIAITSAGTLTALRQLQSQLKSAPKGFTIDISDDTAAQLKVTAGVLDANDKKLRASIAELSR
jgi:hypothetical protein